MKHPDTIGAGYKRRKIAHEPLTQDPLLNVVFEEAGVKIIVVTFYPGKRTGMEVQCNRADDVLTIHLSGGVIDHAEEADGIIVHFSSDDHPVLWEVLKASDFLSRLTRITATAEPDHVVPL